jgi:hypothetical protein
VPGREEVVLDESMGEASVLLLLVGLVPVLRGMELEMAVPETGPTSVLLLEGALGKGR